MKRQTFTQKYREMPDPVMGVMDREDFPKDSGMDYTTYEYSGVAAESRAILQRIHDAINERYEDSQGVFNRVVVIGVENYVAADAWIRHDSDNDSSLEKYLSVEVVVVPGRMIHAPKTNQRALVDHLKGKNK